MTPEQHLAAAKQAVVEKYIYEDFNDPDKRAAFVNEVCLLALTNQAKELEELKRGWLVDKASLKLYFELSKKLESELSKSTEEKAKLKEKIENSILSLQDLSKRCDFTNQLKYRNQIEAFNEVIKLI